MTHKSLGSARSGSEDWEYFSEKKPKAMSKRGTLFSEEQSTMVSTWTTEIIYRPARGGGCTLETSVTAPDLDEEQDDYFNFCSEPIKAKEDFVSAWQECCDRMSVDAEIDREVISRLETICPKLAEDLRGQKDGVGFSSKA
jgi:hypothetical protein